MKLEKGGMAPKMIGTFIANLVAAVIMMRLIARSGIVDLAHGLKLGAGVLASVSPAIAITIQYLWESKPFKVCLIDAQLSLLWLHSPHCDSFGVALENCRAFL